jgi:hypothetical protein
MKKFKAVKDYSDYSIKEGDIFEQRESYNTNLRNKNHWSDAVVNLLILAGILEEVPEPKVIKLEVEFYEHDDPKLKEFKNPYKYEFIDGGYYFLVLNNTIVLIIGKSKINSLLEKPEPEIPLIEKHIYKIECVEIDQDWVLNINAVYKGVYNNGIFWVNGIDFDNSHFNVLADVTEPQYIPGHSYKVKVTDKTIAYITANKEPFYALWDGEAFKNSFDLIRFKPEWVEVVESEAGDE